MVKPAWIPRELLDRIKEVEVEGLEMDALWQHIHMLSTTDHPKEPSESGLSGADLAEYITLWVRIESYTEKLERVIREVFIRLCSEEGWTKTSDPDSPDGGCRYERHFNEEYVLTLDWWNHQNEPVNALILRLFNKVTEGPFEGQVTVSGPSEYGGELPDFWKKTEGRVPISTQERIRDLFRSLKSEHG